MSCRTSLLRWSAALLPLLAAAACGDDGGTGPEATVVEDPCSGSAPLTLGASTDGDLGPGDCRTGGIFRDRWTLEVPSTQWVMAELRSPDFDTWLEVRSASGGLVAENDDWDGRNSTVIVELEAGSYTVVARSYAQDVRGRYTLEVRSAPECEPMGALVLGETGQGRMRTDGCPMPWGAAAQFWTLRVDDPARVRLDLASDAFDEVVVLMDELWRPVHGADWTHPVGFARAELDLAAGEWRVAVTSPGSASGDYTLVTGEAPPCEPGTTLAPGESLSGVLDASDCSFDGWMPADSFVVDLADSTDLSIRVDAAGTSPLEAIVFDRDRQVVGYGSRWESSEALVTRALLPPGAFSVILGSPGGELPVDYDLALEAVVCGEAADTTALGESVTGSLEATDCIRSGGEYRDDWVLVLDAETEVRIDLTSKVLDTYLVLEDEEGSTIAVNDDGGNGLNSRIVQTLTAGTYVLAASSFAPGVTGAYELSVVDEALAAAFVVEDDGGVGRARKDDPLRRWGTAGERRSPPGAWWPAADGGK